MRTTVQITDEQHSALRAIASRRGIGSISVLIEEALDAYLAEFADAETDLLLGLEGVLTESEAHEMRARINRAHRHFVDAPGD